MPIDEQTLIEEVLAAERAWTQAHLELDLTTIEAMMGDDYAIIRPDGSVDGKVAALASYTDDHRQWEYARSDQLDLRLYDETAVVFGRWTAKGMNNGQPFDYQARFMCVYVKRNGRWQIVADQSTPLST